jgi:hypothetical protein
MPWNGSWNGAPDNPSAPGALSAIARAISAASALGARGRTSCKTAGQRFASAHRLPGQREFSRRLHLDRGTPPCCDVMVSVRFVTMTVVSELPAGDTHDVIRHSGQVVAVVVPIEEYQQLRLAMHEQQVNEEFDAARAGYLARREAGAIRYVSHEEAGRRLGMPSR